MRKLFGQLRRDLEGFVEQRDDLVLLLACSEADSVLVLQTLRDLEQSTGTDVYLLFGGAFVDPESYVASAIDHLSEEHRLACQGLSGEGRPPFPPLPTELTDAAKPPAERLVRAIDFARSLLPPDGGHRLVWAMLPAEVADGPSYLQLVSQLAPWTGIRPWMRGVRLVFRYQPEIDRESRPLKSAPRVRVRAIDLGPTAIAGSLQAEAEDSALTDEERMQSLLTLAYLDAAHHRAEAATTKFNLLLGYYQHTGNVLLQAMTIKGLGDVQRRDGNLDQARHWYECALLPAIEAKSALVLADLVEGLGDIAYRQARFADAEQFFDGLDKLRSHLLDPEGKVRALEWRGLSQEKQLAADRAIESWETAAQLCRGIGLPRFLKANLGHLARVYQQLGQHEKMAAVESEIQQVPEEEFAA